ncbi:HAMP domain-containing histidine kinase [bacterium]|nr:HAMP domain-containing histidine kinase [bacterium]
METDAQTDRGGDTRADTQVGRNGKTAFLSQARAALSLIRGHLLFIFLKFRHRRLIGPLRPLAQYLEGSLFPILIEDGEKWLFLDVRENEGNPVLAGVTEEREFEFPGGSHLARELRRIDVRRVQLDVRLEFGQILEALLVLFHAAPWLRDSSAEGQGYEGWNSRLVASAIRDAEGFHKFCARMRFRPDSLTFEVEYCYCELIFSKAIHSYTDLRSNQRDHRALFQAAPRAAVLSLCLFLLPFTAYYFWHSTLAAILLAILALGFALYVWFSLNTLGSLKYDEEHRDLLIEDYIRRIRESDQHLRRLNEDLKRLVEVKDEFLRIASHDLKNPLTTILVSLALLRKNIQPDNPLPREYQDMLPRMQERARDMQRIVEDFLDAQQVENGKLQLRREVVDLNALAQVTVENNREYARVKGIELRTELHEALPTLSADSARIRQVLDNLTGNAIKYSHPETVVVVRTRLDGEGVIVEVSDQGPGLPTHDPEQIFGKFTHLDGRPTGGEKSTGLGLYISRQLIELHGGQIGARANDGRGATFWFRLPF